MHPMTRPAPHRWYPSRGGCPKSIIACTTKTRQEHWRSAPRAAASTMDGKKCQCSCHQQLEEIKVNRSQTNTDDDTGAPMRTSNNQTSCTNITTYMFMKTQFAKHRGLDPLHQREQNPKQHSYKCFWSPRTNFRTICKSGTNIVIQICKIICDDNTLSVRNFIKTVGAALLPNVNTNRENDHRAKWKHKNCDPTLVVKTIWVINNDAEKTKNVMYTSLSTTPLPSKTLRAHQNTEMHCASNTPFGNFPQINANEKPAGRPCAVAGENC